jgi:hypothetical protein
MVSASYIVLRHLFTLSRFVCSELAQRAFSRDEVPMRVPLFKSIWSRFWPRSRKRFMQSANFAGAFTTTIPLATCGASIARLRGADALRLCQLRWSARTRRTPVRVRPTTRQRFNSIRFVTLQRRAAGLAWPAASPGRLGYVVLSVVS